MNLGIVNGRIVEYTNKQNVPISETSKGKAFLRADRYYQVAEFFLHPNRPTEKLEVYKSPLNTFIMAQISLRIPYQSEKHTI